jgi:hypothetical protein
MLSGSRKKKKHGSSDNPGKYVPIAFCDERFQRVSDKLTSIEKKIDTFISEKNEESHAFRNAIVSLVIGAALALLGYALGKM